jgi:excisionase family DNA binding protein
MTGGLLELIVAELETADAATIERARRALGVTTDAPPPSPAALLTCAEAAEHASVHIESIRRAVRSGALPAGRVGRSPRIAPADLAAWLGGDESRPQPPRPRARRPRADRRPLAGALASMEQRDRTGVRSAQTTKRPGDARTSRGMARSE